MRFLFVRLILNGAPAKLLWGQFYLDFTEGLRVVISEHDAIAAALREIDLALQHHGRTNESVGLPPVMHLNVEYLRLKHIFDPNAMRAFVEEHLPNLTVEADLFFR